MTRWLPPVYRVPAQQRRPHALDPARPVLRLVTIGLLTLLVGLFVIGVYWAIVL